MITRLSKLIDVIVDDYKDQQFHHFACYVEREAVERYAFRIAGLAAFQCGTIVEIGTEGGLGSIAMAIAAPKARVLSFDIRKECTEAARQRAEELGVWNVEFYTGESNHVKAYVDEGAISLAYIDGDHSFAPVLRDLLAITDLSGDHTVIAMDDYYDGRMPPGDHFGVTMALRYFLKANPEWYGLCPQPMTFLLTKSRNNPAFLA